MLAALIFDLEARSSTPTSLPTQCWVRGFARHGYRVDARRIRTE
jgi:hypothetical protein